MKKTSERKNAFLVSSDYTFEALKEWLDYFSASGCEQIIMNNQQLLEQLYEGDVLMLTSFLDVGSASFDMWPSIFLIYDRGVVIQTLDDGFVSSMPDGNMVMEAIRRSIKSQRNYFINNYVLEPIK